MYFVRLRLTLKPLGKSNKLQVTDAVFVHAAIMRAIHCDNAEAGRVLHDMQRHKPLSLALYNKNLHLNFFGLFGMDYMHMLVAQLQRNPEIQIGQNTCTVTNVEIRPPGVWGWENLSQLTQHRKLCFSFATPTAVMRQDSTGKRYTVLQPTPEVVFKNLIGRWNSLGGEPLPSELQMYLHDGGCVTEQYKIETLQFCTGKRRQLGFFGDIVYFCRVENPTCIEALNKLTRLAPFVGIGYQTARGMGAVDTRLRV